MSEYLAPGVYIEEIPSGNKPIEAAGTSTAGMVGMTARGPVGQPTLVTSQGGFSRVFGGLLNPIPFTKQRDALPYAVEGFFANGGSRLYVVRVVGEGALEATLDLEAKDTSVKACFMLAAAVVIEGASTAEDKSKITLSGWGKVKKDMRLLIVDGAESEVVTVKTAASVSPELNLAQQLKKSFMKDDRVTLQDKTTVGKLKEEAAEGIETLVLNDVTSLTKDQTVLVGTVDASELVKIKDVKNDGKTLTLNSPLSKTYAAGAVISTLTDSTTVSLRPLIADVAAGGEKLEMDTSGIEAGAVIRITAADNDEYALVADIDDVEPEVYLQGELVNSHPRGARVIPVKSVLTAHARYPGAWGNSLRVMLRSAKLVSTKVIAQASENEISVTLESAFGLFPGSIVTIDDKLKLRREVKTADTATGTVIFTEKHGKSLTLGMTVVSQEFTLSVECMENGKTVESETFENMSLAEEHPRYVLKIIGSWDKRLLPTERPSISGESNLIRLALHDSIKDDETKIVETRVLPLVTDVGRYLSDGNDDIKGVDEERYIGNPSENPNERTGIFAMENEPSVSIVAVPGQTSVTVQKKLIEHCEHMRYRFAVLDTPIGANLAAARAYRQNFDSTRCAIYYPSLERADSFGAPGDRRTISPSGHVLGIYARTDTTRGVHKAPANEVVRGILAFDSKLDKGMQDILNPINLNCFRDFRSENRGLRVYGARVATSDPEFKYINVRRLLLMIAQSLDTGLQWAVFEPNDKMLWDTVKQSVTGFLTTLWRSGALEGQKAEEAFFVNIGYNVTMTQDDIDNGRLIVEIGVAPVKPAEFVIVKISQKTREAQD